MTLRGDPEVPQIAPVTLKGFVCGVHAVLAAAPMEDDAAGDAPTPVVKKSRPTKIEERNEAFIRIGSVFLYLHDRAVAY